LELQEGKLNSWESPTLNTWQMQPPYVIKDPMTATVLLHTTEIQSEINATNILFINFLQYFTISKYSKFCYLTGDEK